MIHLTWMTQLMDTALLVGKETQLSASLGIIEPSGTLIVLPSDCAALAVLWECPDNLWSKQPVSPHYFPEGVSARQFRIKCRSCLK